jgi:hypothetical protein
VTGILKLKPNQLIEHPNGGHVFGVIPELSVWALLKLPST